MKKLLICVLVLLTGCGPGFRTQDPVPNPPYVPPQPPEETVFFPVASATVSVSSYGDLAALAKKKNISIASLFISTAFADVAQGSATVNVVYNNPSSTAFTVDTSSFGNSMTVTGNDLNMGSISLSGLNDNTLKVCTGVGAPGNKCNRLYIRVFTLGTATGGITGIAGFINTADSYGLDVYASTVPTAIGFNASATAASVTNAATVYTYTIPGNKNRIKLTDISPSAIPIKADLSNAGSGNYEMNLVIQYALGYQ